MQFDYYSASVPATVGHCIHEMKQDFSAGFEACDGIQRYPQGVRCLTSGVRIYSGTSQPLPFVVASSGAAVKFAEFVRRVYPKHKVTRLDAAQDYRQKGAFDDLVSMIDPICRDSNVKCMFQGDVHPDQTDGRSMYFGSKDSDVRLLVYEKGLERIGQGDAKADPDWVRMELRVKFRKEMKVTGATLSPEALFGRSRWSVKVSEDVLGKLPEYLPDASLRQTDTMRSLEHMFKQYGRVIRKAHAEIGEDEIIRRFLDAAKNA